MFTRCPSCQTYFKVGAAELGAAHGTVRCSNCDAIFDALDALHDEVPAGPTAVEGAPVVADLFGDLAPVPDEATALSEEAAPDTAEPPTPDAELVGAEAYAVTWTLPDAGTPRRPAQRFWIGASVALAALLAVQVVHAQRGGLAERPLVGPYLRAIYARLAMPIVERTDIRRLTVLRSEITSHAELDGVLELRGAMSNDAPFAQPMPALRVRLEDRWGDTVGVRVFGPAEYAVAHADAALAPGQNAAFDLEIVDPGSEAVGFVIEPCFRSERGLDCQNDAPTRRSGR